VKVEHGFDLRLLEYLSGTRWQKVEIDSKVPNDDCRLYIHTSSRGRIRMPLPWQWRTRGAWHIVRRAYLFTNVTRRFAAEEVCVMCRCM